MSYEDDARRRAEEDRRREEQQRWAREALERQAEAERQRAHEARIRKEGEDRQEALYRQQRDLEAKSAQEAERFRQQQNQYQADAQNRQRQNDEAQRHHKESLERSRDSQRNHDTPTKTQKTDSRTSSDGGDMFVGILFVLCLTVIIFIVPGLLLLGLTTAAFNTTSERPILLSFLVSASLLCAIRYRARDWDRALLIFFAAAVIAFGTILTIRFSARDFYDSVAERLH